MSSKRISSHCIYNEIVKSNQSNGEEIILCLTRKSKQILCMISIESNDTFVPEVTMYNDRSSCWTKCSQSTTSTKQRAKVVEASASASAVAVAAAVTVVEVGAAEVLGIVAAAPNQVLVSHLTTKVRP